jgi:hypothetical protein
MERKEIDMFMHKGTNTQVLLEETRVRQQIPGADVALYQILVPLALFTMPQTHSYRPQGCVTSIHRNFSEFQ